MTTHEWFARIADAWCLFAHSSPMWPSHGHYRCRECLRVHRVPWEATNADLAHFDGAVALSAAAPISDPMASSSL